MMRKAEGRRILLRCDANPNLGLGHVARCQALAAALDQLGAECIMLGPDQTYQTSDVFRDWIRQPFGGERANPSSATATGTDTAVVAAKAALADANWLAQIANNYQADWLVVDDYRVSEHYQQVLRAHACRWLQFDGSSPQRLWADVVLNSSPAARAEDYQDRVANAASQLLLGPRYAILRTEFADASANVASRTSTNTNAKLVTRKTVERESESPIQIYLNFGGGDDRGALRWCAQTLLDAFPHPVHLKLVSGEQNPNNGALAEWASRQGPQLEFRVNPPGLSELMLECELAILAGGTSCYEADACGLPMLLLPLVPNQLTHARAWAAHGRAHLIEGWSDASPAALRDRLIARMLEWHRERVEASPKTVQHRRRLTDGLGAKRVAERLMV